MTPDQTPEWVKRAKVGDKVVCARVDIRGVLTKRLIYEITFIGIRPIKTWDGVMDVGFCVKKGNTPIVNVGFHWSCFKPLSKRSTDTGMKILKGILKDAPEQVSA